MNLASDWNDYQILDMANGEKLEKWNNITLVRPDPQIIGNKRHIQKNGKKQMQNIQEVILVEVPGIIIKNYLQHGK